MEKKIWVLNGQLGAISALQGRVKRAISSIAARNLPPLIGFLAACGLFPAYSAAQTTDATWVGPSTWRDNTHWSYNAGPNAFPNGIDAIARFAGASQGSVDLGLGVEIGQMSITAGSYSFTGTAENSLTFLSSGTASLDVAAGSQTFLAVVAESPLTVSNTSGNPIVMPILLAPSTSLNVEQGVLNTAAEIDQLNIESLGTVRSISSSFISGLNVEELTGSGQILLANGRTFTVGNENSTVFSGSISQDAINGNGFFTKQGSGTLSFTGSNSFFVGDGLSRFNIQEGTISVGSAANLGNPSSIALFGTLQVTGSFAYGNLVGFNDGSVLEVATGATFTLSGNIAVNSYTKAGEGTLNITLAVQSQYEGETQIQAGTLQVSADGALGTSSLAFTGNSRLFFGAAIPSFNHSIALSTGIAGTVDVGSNNSTIASQISGSGVLQKAGSGILTLSNAGNNYTGGTNISAGTLQAGAASVLPGTGLFDLTASGASLDLQSFDQTIGNLTGVSGTTVTLGSAALTAGDSTDQTFNGIISGTGGSFIKQGSGTLNFTGANSYTGITTLQAGRLNILGSLAGSTLVDSGAILGGTGTLQAVASSGGTIAPGTSIGTLTVSSLSLDSNSITLIEITPSASSLLAVTGPATLAGRVQVLQDGDRNDYPVTFSYEIVSVGGGIAGSYNPTVLGGAEGFLFSLVQNADSVILTYLRQIPTGNLLPNAKAFAEYLNQNDLSSPVTETLSGLSGEVLEDALQSASPQRNAFVPFAAQNTLFGLSEILNGHLADQRFYRALKGESPVALLFAERAESNLIAGLSLWPLPKKGKKKPRGPCPDSFLAPDPCDRASFWLGGFGEYAHQDEEDENPAFHFGAGGGLAAFDYYGIDGNLMGFGAGYAYTHLVEEQNLGRANIHFYFANIYDTVYFDNFYFEVCLWGVFNRISNTRHIAYPGVDVTAKSHIDSWQFLSHLGLGYKAQSGSSACEPFAQVDLPVDWQGAFQERDAGPFNMNQTSHTSVFLRAETGVRLYQATPLETGAWMLMEKISYIYKNAFGTGDVSASIAGVSNLFSVESFSNAQNLFSAGLEVLWRAGQKNPRLLSAAVNTEFSSSYWSAEGIVRFGKDF